MIYLTLHKHHPKITGKSPYGTPRKEQPYGLILSPPRRPRIHRAVRRLSIFSVCAFSADPNRGEIKKMQNRRKSSRRRTSVRQRRFSAVEKAKTLFHLLKESARIPTAFRKSDYTKAVIKKLVFAFSVCAFLASPRAFSVRTILASQKAYFISMSVSSHISGASYPSRLTVVAATSESPNSPLSSLTVYRSAVKLS